MTISEKSLNLSPEKIFHTKKNNQNVAGEKMVVKI